MVDRIFIELSRDLDLATLQASEELGPNWGETLLGFGFQWSTKLFHLIAPRQWPKNKAKRCVFASLTPLRTTICTSTPP